MANPTDSRPERFRAELDNGEVVEADGSTVRDPASDRQVAAVLLRMTPARAHALGHVLDDWSRTALVFAEPSSSEPTERALAWTLEAGSAALGDPAASRCRRSQPSSPTAVQRLAASQVLRQRDPSLTSIQRIAVVDSAARWLGQGDEEDVAWALLEAACRDAITANFVYLALIEPPGPDR